MLDCSTCKGSGKTTIKVIHHGQNELNENCELNCIDCDGKGKVTAEQNEILEYRKWWYKHCWCKCDPPSDHATYHDDGEGVDESCPSKHHYHCDECGKITQVG